MKIPGSLDVWSRASLAVIGAALCTVGGSWAYDQSGWSFMAMRAAFVLGGLATLILLAYTDKRRDRGQKPQCFIDPGEYQVHTLRPATAEERVIVVVVRRRWWGKRQSFKMYDLPLHLFDQDPNLYAGTSAVVMTVVMRPSGLRIQLHRGKVKLKIVNASTQKDPA